MTMLIIMVMVMVVMAMVIMTTIFGLWIIGMQEPKLEVRIILGRLGVNVCTFTVHRTRVLLLT